MLNFVVALKTEAGPLIEHFSLKLQPNTTFPVFSSADTNLVISGMGRNQASAATAWLAATAPAAVWVNFGIAGHKSKEAGNMLVAHKISEAGTGKSWYPVHIKTALETSQLTTFDTVQRNYQPNTLHDMEASGFYEAAIRFSTAELTHSVKVVSDNESHPIESIDKAQVETLITENIPQLSGFCAHLCHMAHEVTHEVSAAKIDCYHERWKFTVTQQHQLKHLLQRRLALGIDSKSPSDSSTLPADLCSMHNSKAVLKWLLNDTNARAEFY